MITKKHFEAMASIIKGARKKRCYGGLLGATYHVAIDDMAKDIADYFKEENPRFDKKKFMEACGE